MTTSSSASQGDSPVSAEPLIAQIAGELACMLEGVPVHQDAMKEKLLEFAKEIQRAAIEPSGF